MNQVDNEQSMMLNDGRKLGYQVLGDPAGKPLFFFHGTPGSRLTLAKTDLIAQIPGVQFILPERPGYGISDPKPGRSIIDWADDVSELADRLGLETFSVSGGSGGGPYALACGARMADRVNSVLLFNSAAPVDFKGAKKGMMFGNRLGYALAKFAPWAMRFVMKMSVNAFQKSPTEYVQSMGKKLPEPDRILMEKSEFVDAVVRDFTEAYRNGGEGHLQDVILGGGAKGWGFELADVTMPVYVWHGEQDTLSPIQTVRRMVQDIPNCQTYYLPEAGHLLIDYPSVVEQVEQVFASNPRVPVVSRETNR